jgi:DNA repair exonuclease SbcCD ATPase subunit
VITFIKERLGELDKEKDELKEYEQLDKNRRALEYNIYDKELLKSNEQLAQMESTRDDERDRQTDLYARLREIQDMIQNDEDSLSSFQQSLKRMETANRTKQSELEELSKKRSSVEAELQEIEASFRAKAIEREQVCYISSLNLPFNTPTLPSTILCYLIMNFHSHIFLYLYTYVYLCCLMCGYVGRRLPSGGASEHRRV